LDDKSENAADNSANAGEIWFSKIFLFLVRLSLVPTEFFQILKKATKSLGCDFICLAELGNSGTGVNTRRILY
jgi:hypothetical protein